MDTSFQFDAELIGRYDIQGPRYTSYPSAAEFSAGFQVDDYRRAVAAANRCAQSVPLSLYVHVPFCRSLCYYCGCNKIVTRHREKFEPYVDQLLQEATLQSTLIDSARPVKQLHFGGGTPTYLAPAQLSRLVSGLANRFNLAPDIEASIEIDPRTVDASYLQELRRMGFNRISLGVQDFDSRVQRAVNRIQPVEQVAELTSNARALGFESISFDLIYGLPEQNNRRFSRTLDQVIQLAPERLAIYNYAHLPQRFRAQRLIDTAAVPNAGQKLELLELSMSMLNMAGYRYIGMDHFAQPHDSLSKALDDGSLQRNFQGYSTHAACDLVGLGVSAISNPLGAFAQNKSDLTQWQAEVDSGHLPIARGVVLNVDDRIRGDVINRIMCRSTLCYAEVAERWQIDFQDYFAQELAALHELIIDGLIEVDSVGFVVTPRGRLLLRIIAMVFDRYRPQLGETRFSKVI